MHPAAIAALLTASVSIAAAGIFHHEATSAIRHAFVLVIPIASIAFPEVIEASYRRTTRGMIHGGTGPTPAFMIRLAAWGLLLAMIFAHHCLWSARN